MSEQLKALCLLATTSAHKTAETAQLLAPFGIAVRQQPPASEVVEDGATFAANAQIKAAALLAHLKSGHGDKLPPADAVFVVADDSGLQVDALNGAPGLFTARYAAAVPPEGDQDAANRTKLLQAVAAVPPAERTAQFVCALVALPWPDGAPIVAQGLCTGSVAQAECGAHGFGYDSVFVPAGEEQTLAELGPAFKARVSHRATAARALGEQLLRAVSAP